MNADNKNIIDLNLKKDQKIKKTDLIMLRPISTSGIDPYKIKSILGKKLLRNIKKSEEIKLKDLK